MKNSEIILNELDKMFPNPNCELKFNSPFELLVAVILSAQCTDKRVNMVTEELFRKYNTPKDFAEMPLEMLEKLIHSCGFYHNKALSIKKQARTFWNASMARCHPISTTYAHLQAWAEKRQMS